MTTQRRYHWFVSDSVRWDGFELRTGDIVISTPPKCGTTWMQMLVASLLLPDGLDRPLTRISPWLEMLTAPLDEVVATLRDQRHRRFIKSHTPFDGLPDDPRLRYLCVARDPRDVALSWDNHRRNMDDDTFVAARFAASGTDDLAELGPMAPAPEDPMDRFWDWVESEPPPLFGPASLAGTMHHLATFWERRDDPRIALFHYADLVADLPAEVRRLAAFLEVAIDDDRAAEIAAGASFASMRSKASELAPGAPDGHWRSDDRFFDKGPERTWRDVLTDDAAIGRYERAVEALGHDPELVRWAHRDPARLDG